MRRNSAPVSVVPVIVGQPETRTAYWASVGFLEL